jgi:predicted DNA-binding protein (MmcQ/YjbR family)
MSGRSGESRAELALRKLGLSLPETTEDFPWGHRTLKVKGKAFVFMGSDDEGFGLSMKLPESGPAALSLPFTEPTGYGLGKSGWVSAKFAPGADVPVELLERWLMESYRAVAPKKLVALMDEKPVASAKKKKPVASKKAAAAKKKPAATKKPPARKKPAA